MNKEYLRKYIDADGELSEIVKTTEDITLLELEVVFKGWSVEGCSEMLIGYQDHPESG